VPSVHLREDWKRRVWWRWALFLIFGLLLWSLVAWIAARALVTRAELERADALVVFSGSSAYKERTRRAAGLFREGRAPLIILTNDNQQSGWSRREQRNPLFVERARDELILLNVPAERIIILPETVTSTYEEAMLVRDYATSHELHSVLFVTSAYHSRRALWTTRQVFAEGGVNVGLDAPPPGEETPRPLTWWLHTSGWRMVAEEYPKLIYYWLWYR
jgi:uncharacterized SAM-binding protein YcdF (DUF218 family)